MEPQVMTSARCHRSTSGISHPSQRSSSGTDPRKGWRTPLNKNRYSEQRDAETRLSYFVQHRSLCRFDSSGTDPRKGWRTPLNINRYSEQRDEEAGLSYCVQHRSLCRFDSSGKERDIETGLSYFGARYYDADLTTGWLSVDPMADKYPSISPYAYCAWNPVKLIDPDGREVDDWYNLKGELIKHTDSGTKKYLVLTEGTDVDESKTIPVPQQETLNKMSAVYIGNEKSANASIVQNEKGMAVKSDGLPTQVVTGHPDYITKEQWNPAMIEVGDMSNLDFLIHLHPINLQDMKVGGPDPSDVDRDVHNFFNSKVNVIQYFNPTLDFNRSGLPTKIGNYVPSVSFYNQTSPKSIHTMSFRSFHSLVEKINASH